MNPLHLAWMLPLATIWGLSAGFYFSRKRHARATANLVQSLIDSERDRLLKKK